MNRVIVNDASCLIDLRKGGLLTVLCELPYQLVVPLPVRASEILDFSDDQWRLLDRSGLVTYDLPGSEVAQALALRQRRPALSPNDCFCFVTALVHSGILLTGDAPLRRFATENGMRVHGVLWVIDELEANRVCPTPLLTHALRTWQSDDAVFLPEKEISARLESIGAQK